MDFLTNLYSNDNFGIILFITISILVLAFLIVLFFGKKDQKERKLAETKSLEVNNTLAQNAFVDNQPTVQLNIDPEIFDRAMKEDIKKEVEEPSVAVENITVAPPIMEDHSYDLPMDFMENTPSIEPEKEEENTVTPPKMDFDFDALADSISKELEGISQTEQREETKVVMDDVISPVEMEPIRKEPSFELPPIQEEVKPVIIEEPESTLQFTAPAKPKMPSPTQFSSVFVSKKKEEKALENEEPKQMIVEEPTQAVIPQVTPAKPNIELPKTIDLPKLNNNQNTTNSNIVFSSLEEDVSTYSKDYENRM